MGLVCGPQGKMGWGWNHESQLRPTEAVEGSGVSGRAMEAGLPKTAQRAWGGASWGDRWPRAPLGWYGLRQKN